MKAVIFDMDGVIIDSEWLVVDCWKAVARKYKIPDIEKLCRKCLGLNRDATIKVFFGALRKAISLMSAINRKWQTCFSSVQ